METPAGGQIFAISIPLFWGMGLHLFFSKYNNLPLPLFLLSRKHADILGGPDNKSTIVSPPKVSILSVHSTSLQCSSIELNVEEILGAALIFDYDNTKAEVLHAIYLFLPRDINLLHNATIAEQHYLR